MEKRSSLSKVSEMLNSTANLLLVTMVQELALALGLSSAFVHLLLSYHHFFLIAMLQLHKGPLFAVAT